MATPKRNLASWTVNESADCFDFSTGAAAVPTSSIEIAGNAVTVCCGTTGVSRTTRFTTPLTPARSKITVA